MKRGLIAVACCGLLLSPTALGHGGTYRGPGDIVPPGGLGGGPGGGSAPPTPPSPGQPGPGPNKPGPGVTPGQGPVGVGPGPGPAATADVQLEDHDQWSYWWEFNKHSYLNLRERLADARVRTGSEGWYLGRNTRAQTTDRVSVREADRRQVVVPALLRTLAAEDHNDIVTGCLLSLAKIGDGAGEDGSSAILEVTLPYLADPNQEIAETAALALGILGHGAAAEPLLALLADDDTGRELVGGGTVDRRTRAFAAYALGLLASQSATPAVRDQVHEGLMAALEDDRVRTRDLPVAALQAMSLYQLDLLEAEQGPSLTGHLEFLLTFVTRDEVSPLVRAHVPTALARAWRARGRELGEAWRQRLLVAVLELAEGRRTDAHLRRSAVLALGELADRDGDELDARTRRFLLRDLPKLGDRQARRFGLIAMAQVAARRGTDDAGLDELRSELLRQMSRGKSGMREWAALSLGLFGHLAPEEFGDDLERALGAALEAQRGPKIGAYAVAAGLVDAEALVPAMLEKLDDLTDDDARGYLALGLGMIGDPATIVRLENLVADATYRSGLLRQAAIGLGMAGGRESARLLVDSLDRSTALSAQAAIAGALGIVGDRTSLVPLVGILEDEDRPDLARGLAAAALGNVCDARLLPWNEPITRDINYRAATETLTGQGGKGILDIL